jgi:hypothetical protein
MNNQKEMEKEFIKKEFPKFIETLEQCLNFKRWGFQMTFYGVSTKFPPSVIYDSEWCRVRFLIPIPDWRDRESTIHIRYGRLHAPNDEELILNDGEYCYCWHDIGLALEFLELVAPQQAANKNFASQSVIKGFMDSIDPNLHQLEWLTKTHALIWDHYGKRFFELFDLRTPNLWKQYDEFVKEFRAIKVTKSTRHYGGPWPANIC